MPVSVVVRARTEVVSWSLYWKEPLSVLTLCLDDARVEVSGVEAFDHLIGQHVLAAAAAHNGWPPVEKLQRIKGFDQPWERLLVKGRELALDQPLVGAGIVPGDVLVVVRRVLKADGWRIKQPGDFLGSSDDEADEGEGQDDRW